MRKKKERIETYGTRITGEDTLKATDILNTITVLNGRDDIGLENFIRGIKRAKLRCSLRNIILDFIIAQSIKASAEKAVRFIPIDFYDDLLNALR